MSAAEQSVHRAECVRLGHPGMTYNPLSDQTWCGCGEVVTQGNTDAGVRCCWTEVVSAEHVWRGACRS